MARFDRCYALRVNGNSRLDSIDKYVILGDYSLSNHHPITFIYTFREIKHTNKKRFFPNDH
jgi:hypothetical protein